MKSAHRNTLAFGALALMALTAAGCGRSSHKSSSVDTGANAQEAPALPQEATYATYRHDEPGDFEPSGEPKSQIPMARSGDPQPPDLEVMTSDTTVERRDRVDVTARTTADAVEVVMWDGIGDRQALIYDEAANVWRGSYRVPLNTPADRLGLSVTAKDGEKRWRRVWVFLTIHENAEVPADSSTVTEGGSQ